MTKIFIDDIRNPPDSSWTVARTSEEALNLMRGNLPTISHISFDHDLGGEDTSRVCASYLEELYHVTGKRLDIITTIHSANPVGIEWLTWALKNSTRFTR